MGLLTLAGRALAKRSTEVAKRSTDVVPAGARRTEKFMGMVEEVPRTQLEYTAKEAAKRGGGKAALAAGIGAAGGAAYLASRDKEDTTPKRVVSKSSSMEDTGVGGGRGRVNDTSRSDKEETSRSGGTKAASSFGAAFKEARSEGLKTFTFEGKKYTTELASEKTAEKRSAPAAKETATETSSVREGRNENISDDTRARAMESVKDLEEKKYAKGGMVTNKGIGASMKPHNVFTSKGKK